MDWKNLDLFRYLLIGSGALLVLAIVIYFLPMRRIKVPAVILSACQSAMTAHRAVFPSVASQLLKAGVAGVVAMTYSVYVSAAVRFMARFLPALLIFNVVLVFSHWPLIVDAGLRSGWVHFGLHTLLFLSSLVVWLPIVSPLPEIPRLQPVLRMMYLFAWSVVPTVPASFLTFGSSPLYKFYEHVPHLWSLSTLQDQQLAGLIMKLGAGLLLWMLIAVVFFRWAAEEERANTPRHGLHELDRELTQMGLRR